MILLSPFVNIPQQGRERLGLCYFGATTVQSSSCWCTNSPILNFPKLMKLHQHGICHILQGNLAGLISWGKSIFVHLPWGKPQPLLWVNYRLLMSFEQVWLYPYRQIRKGDAADHTFDANPGPQLPSFHPPLNCPCQHLTHFIGAAGSCKSSSWALCVVGSMLLVHGGRKAFTPPEQDFRWWIGRSIIISRTLAGASHFLDLALIQSVLNWHVQLNF